MRKKLISKMATTCAMALLSLSIFTPKQAHAQTEPFIGQMTLFAGSYCPRSWAMADGQILAISSNQALFSLLGTIYGGDGRTTFALPDLRGRVPVHMGTGPGLSPVPQGQKFGREIVSLDSSNLPSHSHTVNATDAIGNKKGPGTDLLAKSSLPEDSIYHDGPANKEMHPSMISNTGSNEAFGIRNPSLGLRWCVSLQGVYPSRS
jgi:microcystin-dependent protein